MKTNSYRFKDFFYLFSLYFKRGRGSTAFYVVMLFLGLTLPAILLESNAKVKALIDEINSKLPPNRVKLVIPANVRKSQSKGLLTSLFGLKSNSPSKIVKYKDFITPSLMSKVKKIDGVSHIVPLYSIDFPMGIVFAIPGTRTPIQSQMIGSGLSAKDGNPFIYPSSKIKKFEYKPGRPVPILMSHFIIPLVNSVAQNNGVDNFRLKEKDLIGFRIKVFAGRSQLSAAFDSLGNGSPESFSNIDNANFSDKVDCVIVGFVDMDYSIGLAFPQNFLARYKSKYWGNFTAKSYDSLVLDVPLSKTEKTTKKFKKLGFKISSDSGIITKISQVLEKQQQGFGLFLTFISFVILIFGMIILGYTVLWILKGKTLEFSVYQFFGASKMKVVLLYNTYLTTLNIISFAAASIVLKLGFAKVGTIVGSFQNRVPKEFQSIFQAPFLKHFLVADSLLWTAFILLEVTSFVFVYFYIKSLNKRI